MALNAAAAIITDYSKFIVWKGNHETPANSTAWILLTIHEPI
jgi:hypothetical protein